MCISVDCTALKIPCNYRNNYETVGGVNFLGTSVSLVMRWSLA